MTTSQPFNHNIISHISPQKQVLHSSLDLKRLTLRRSHPKFIEFRLEDSVKTNTHPMKKLMTSISKTAFKLRNPPTKAAISNGSLTRHLRGLEVRPEPAEKYITDITRRFSKLKHFAILDEQDAFVPMRIKKKVHPIRTLKSFVYDHEFCQDFIRCARYASELKIRKTSLDLNHLKRLQRLEKMHLILKTKYLSLPEEDVKFRDDLAKILLKLPIFGRIILEQEVDPETCPYTFMELQKALKEKTRTHLIADFIDVSSQRNKNIDLEKMLQTINEFGIESLKVGYVGIAQAMNRYGRSFYAPLHIKPELYSRFLKALMNTPFKNVEFAPIVHSSYADADLNNALKEFVRSSSKINVPKISMIYNLDMMEFENIHLMSDLYAQGASAYEVTVSSTTILRKGLPEKLEEHFCEGFKRIDMANSSLSLHVVAKNNDILGKLTNIIASGGKTIDLKAIGIQIQEPIGKNTLPNILELISGSGAFKLVKEINVEFTERSMPNSEDLSSFLRGMLEIPKNLNKLTLTYHNTEEAEEVLKKVFEGLRSVNLKTELEYQINDESSMNE